MKKNVEWIFILVICISFLITGSNVFAVKEREENKMNHHQHHHSNHGENEVEPQVSYSQGELLIELKDKDGKAPSLKTSHEKIMHLIIMSSDLNDYYHLHPEAEGDGEFVQKIDLSDGGYKVFVDISPENLNYAVKPIEIIVGDKNQDTKKNELVADTNFTKTVKGQTVELKFDPIEVNKEVTFNFEVKDATPEPYLGALGHVVITDEAGEKFIHVHPLSENETVFMTEFDERGKYKMWAEFKVDGEVLVYPFVIEVK